MYHYALAVMIAAVIPDRKADRRPAGPAYHRTPQGLADLNDHHLRDIGFERERTARPRDHLMRM
ncbi:MAG: hypothetical protein F9K19_13690 [Rhizobiaceae bacterium]|nr:MAG: hypothetical protein F9K19_13690 [Rhizobiaceae bacterium]CAG1008693.1 hypothetical protein RHIZO_03530 [Rhizobiaceae bacterium]